jgi:hypothetical protein
MLTTFLRKNFRHDKFFRRSWSTAETGFEHPSLYVTALARMFHEEHTMFAQRALMPQVCREQMGSVTIQGRNTGVMSLTLLCAFYGPLYCRSLRKQRQAGVVASRLPAPETRHRVAQGDTGSGQAKRSMGRFSMVNPAGPTR